MEKNQQLEQRVKDILKQSIDSEDSISKRIRSKKHGKPLENNAQNFQQLPTNNDNDIFYVSDNDNDNDNNNDTNTQILPNVRQSPNDNNIIEVEVPINVEPVPEVRHDPVPELRAAFHKIAEEIQGLNSQIAEVESNKSKCEVVISKLQSELRKAQMDNDRAQQETQEIMNQIENNREKIQKLKLTKPLTRKEIKCIK